MNVIKKQPISSKFKAFRVAAVCVAASLVVGFAKPETQLQKASGSHPAGLSAWVAHPLNRPQPGSKDKRLVKPKIYVISPTLTARASRPSSYAPKAIVSGVLNKISSRIWLESAKYSPDLARDELLGNRPVEFHGVGFPDIRKDRKPKHFFNAVTADPTQWNQMITWRNSKSDSGVSEAIPHVRCMGLTPQAVARRADRYEDLITELSQRYNISSNLVKAVVTEESCFNNEALSHVGAQGLMQLMPETATWLKVQDPADPKDNLRGGVRYLSSLLKEFGSVELALAAYNAGPGNVRRYKGVPPFAETRAYLQKVQSNYRRYSAVSNFEDRHSS